VLKPPPSEPSGKKYTERKIVMAIDMQIRTG